MAHVALALALSAMIAAALPSPGLFLAIGLGIAAIGTGWLGYRRPGDPGFTRLARAAAITVGVVGCLSGNLRVRLALATTMAAALSTACYSDAQVGYSVGYVGPAPRLAYVSPGVQVIADYDYPVFYADSFYWRYDGGVWYRSSAYTGGWQVSYNVPVAV